MRGTQVQMQRLIFDNELKNKKLEIEIKKQA